MASDVVCDYCERPIEQETWGWGFYFDEFGKYAFHTECIEMEGLEDE